MLLRNRISNPATSVVIPHWLRMQNGLNHPLPKKSSTVEKNQYSVGGTVDDRAGGELVFASVNSPGFPDGTSGCGRWPCSWGTRTVQ